MDKLKDVADYWRKVKSGELPAPGPNEISITVCTLDGAVSRITALLVELEEKDKRVSDLEAIATEYASKFQKAQDAAKHLVIMNDSAQTEIANLKTLLATPVRLPTEHELHQVACSECAGNCLELVESTVRSACFKCVGDE